MDHALGSKGEFYANLQKKKIRVYVTYRMNWVIQYHQIWSSLTFKNQILVAWFSNLSCATSFFGSDAWPHACSDVVIGWTGWTLALQEFKNPVLTKGEPTTLLFIVKKTTYTVVSWNNIWHRFFHKIIYYLSANQSGIEKL